MSEKNTEATLNTIIEVVTDFAMRGNASSPARIEPGTSLLRDGLIDSLSLAELALALEQRLGLELGTGALIRPDFESPNTLWTRIQELRRESAGPRSS